jgi:hypothetical protein
MQSQPQPLSLPRPWMDRSRCTLLASFVRELLRAGETPCAECNESRAKCGGLPRRDGQARP